MVHLTQEAFGGGGGGGGGSTNTSAPYSHISSLKGDELNGFVRQLSRHIGCNIKQLARALNAESTIFELDRQYPRDLKELIRSFFEKWLKMEEGHASIDQLMRGLKAAELYEILAKMEAYVQEGTLRCR